MIKCTCPLNQKEEHEELPSSSHWLEIEESDNVLIGVMPEHQTLPLGDGTDLSPHYLRYITEVSKEIRIIEISNTFFLGQARLG